MSTEISAMKNLKYYSLEWLEENIVLVKFKDGIAIDKNEAIEIIGEIVKFVNNQPFKIIADAQNIFGTITAEGREVFSTAPEYIKLRKKSVFIVNNLPTRLLINFYQKFNLKHKDTKTFSTLEKGIIWLKKA